MNYLENYYANYDEEGRLASNHGQVEYLTTMKYIHEVIGGTEQGPEGIVLHLHWKGMK